MRVAESRVTGHSRPEFERTNRMLRNVLGRIVVISSALALVGAPAVASQRVVGGGICYQTPTAGFTGTAAYDDFGSVRNDSTTGELAIDCPIVRENPSADIAAGEISFDIFDRNPSLDVTCYFINEIADTAGWGTANVVSAASTGVNQVGYVNRATTTQLNDLGVRTFSHVRCSIPRKVSGSTNHSHLARIWVNEP
jgi:hypothetical protein